MSRQRAQRFLVLINSDSRSDTDMANKLVLGELTLNRCVVRQDLDTNSRHSHVFKLFHGTVGVLEVSAPSRNVRVTSELLKRPVLLLIDH